MRDEVIELYGGLENFVESSNKSCNFLDSDRFIF